MILEEFDKAKNAVLEPYMVTERIENFPDVTISYFSPKLFSSLLEFLKPERMDIRAAGDLNPVYEVHYQGERFALYQSCIGEPKCVLDYEKVLAMGSKCLILLGSCGVLDKDIQDCGIIIPTKAIRDEGCSYHYAPPSDFIDVNTKYKDLFMDVLNELQYSFVEGTTWTTDALFRETREKVNRRKEQGAICVEMECAGMQALCDFRRTDFFQFFYAEDNLDHSLWQPRSLGARNLDEKTKIALLAFELGLKIKKANSEKMA